MNEKLCSEISCLSWPVHYIADRPSRLSGSIWGKRSLRFYRKHILPSIEIIERNHRRINVLTRGEGKTQKEKEKKRPRLGRRSLSLEELASRGSESRRLSLTHCNVSTFLSDGAVPRRGFIKQFLAAADPKNPRRGKWRRLTAESISTVDPIDWFSTRSREFSQARWLFASSRSRKVGEDCVVMQRCGSLAADLVSKLRWIKKIIDTPRKRDCDRDRFSSNIYFSRSIWTRWRFQLWQLLWAFLNHCS